MHCAGPCVKRWSCACEEVLNVAGAWLCIRTDCLGIGRMQCKAVQGTSINSSGGGCPLPSSPPPPQPVTSAFAHRRQIRQAQHVHGVWWCVVGSPSLDSSPAHINSRNTTATQTNCHIWPLQWRPLVPSRVAPRMPPHPVHVHVHKVETRR